MLLLGLSARKIFSRIVYYGKGSFMSGFFSGFVLR